MPLQTGAYLALSRKFCGQVNISEIFPWCAKPATPGQSLAMVRSGTVRASFPLKLCPRRSVRAYAKYHSCFKPFFLEPVRRLRSASSTTRSRAQL